MIFTNLVVKCWYPGTDQGFIPNSDRCVCWWGSSHTNKQFSDGVRSHRLRAQSHETAPTPTHPYFKHQLEIQVSPVFLTNSL